MQNCPGNIRSIAWSLRFLPSSRSTSRNDWMRGGHTVQEQARECEVRRINRIPGTGCAVSGVPAIKLISRNVWARAREDSCAIVCIPYHLNGSQQARGLYLTWLRDRVLRQGCRSSSISFAAQRVRNCWSFNTSTTIDRKPTIFTCSQGDSQNATFSFHARWRGADLVNGNALGRQWERIGKAR